MVNNYITTLFALITVTFSLPRLHGRKCIKYASVSQSTSSSPSYLLFSLDFNTFCEVIFSKFLKYPIFSTPTVQTLSENENNAHKKV